MKKTIKIFTILCMAAALLSSCGTAKKADRNKEPQQETTVQKDSLPPTHPPVVVPHTWRDA